MGSSSFRPSSAKWLWAAVILYIGLIITLSSLPGSVVPKLGITYSDKVVHCIEYSALGFLFCAALGAKRYFAILVGVLAGCLGFLDEAYQQFTPGRDSSPLDAIADVVGGGLGGCFWLVCRHFWLKSRTRIHSGVDGVDTNI